MLRTENGTKTHSLLDKRKFKHELRVLGQRLNPDIFVPGRVHSVYKRIKRRVIYGKPR